MGEPHEKWEVSINGGFAKRLPYHLRAGPEPAGPGARQRLGRPLRLRWVVLQARLRQRGSGGSGDHAAAPRAASFRAPGRCGGGGGGVHIMIASSSLGGRVDLGHPGQQLGVDLRLSATARQPQASFSLL